MDMARANFPHEIKAETFLKRKIGDDERGVGVDDRVERLLCGLGFGADSKIVLVVDQGREPAPQQRIRVDDEDALLASPVQVPRTCVQVSLPDIVLRAKAPARIRGDVHFAQGGKPYRARVSYSEGLPHLLAAWSPAGAFARYLSMRREYARADDAEGRSAWRQRFASVNRSLRFPQT